MDSAMKLSMDLEKARAKAIKSRKLRTYQAKTVIRRWRTKSGEIHQKTYTYESGRGRVIVDERGGIHRSALAEAKRAIDESKDLGKVEKDMMKYYLDYYVKEAKESGKTMRTTGFFGRMAEDRISRMFANAGTDVATEAQRLGVTEAQLLDPNNWNGDVFTDPNTGRSYLFTFSYWEDELWEEL